MTPEQEVEKIINDIQLRKVSCENENAHLKVKVKEIASEINASLEELYKITMKLNGEIEFEGGARTVVKSADGTVYFVDCDAPKVKVSITEFI